MAEGEKPGFAPLPARAIGDPRLSALHLRALGAIAMHDRLGRNRQGCWAGNKRLAEMIGCDYTRLSAALTNLATWGYIEREPHPLNKRMRVFRVLYTDDDWRMMKGAEADKGLPDGKELDRQNAADSLPNGKDEAAIVCRDVLEAQEYQWDEGV